jgi:hypothetical protein
MFLDDIFYIFMGRHIYNTTLSIEEKKKDGLIVGDITSSYYSNVNESTIIKFN